VDAANGPQVTQGTEKVRTADEQSRNQPGLSLKEDCCDHQHDPANEPIESAELEQ
jgi:hypothetical protein